MRIQKLAVCALCAGALIASSSAWAQSAPVSTTSAADRALINALIKKGVITDAEAQQIESSVAKSSAGDDVITNASDKYITSLVLTGRFQTQFADLGTSINGFNNVPPTTLPAHPVASEHFLLRRIYLGTTVKFIDGFSGYVNYDFANLSFDAAYIEWKKNDAFFVDAGFKKVPFDYEEVTSSGDLRAIERSPVTRYFDEPNNGRRLGAASYRTGVFAGGTENGFFYNVAVTNPERNEYSGDSSSGTTVNGSGGVGNYSNSTNNNLAFYGWGGYNAKWTDGSLKVGGEGGSLRDQGGPGTSVGVGNNLTIYGAFADFKEDGFNLQGEYLGANDQNAVTAYGVVRKAKPTGYWIQPTLYLVPKKLEAVVRYSSLDSDDRGVALSDGIRGATSGGTMDKMDELYVGGNWYIIGNDVKLQFGYIRGTSSGAILPTTSSGVIANGVATHATADGVRSQVQVNF